MVMVITAEFLNCHHYNPSLIWVSKPYWCVTVRTGPFPINEGTSGVRTLTVLTTEVKEKKASCLFPDPDIPYPPILPGKPSGDLHPCSSPFLLTPHPAPHTPHLITCSEEASESPIQVLFQFNLRHSLEQPRKQNEGLSRDLGN